jgi:predicted  nucleic acid-binding Zn-ribbon protein
MKNPFEWLLWMVAAVTSFFGLRGTIILVAKENSVGRTAIKKVKERLKSLEDDKVRLESENSDFKNRLKHVERDADDRYEEMREMEKTIRQLKSIVESKVSI